MIHLFNILSDAGHFFFFSIVSSAYWITLYEVKRKPHGDVMKIGPSVFMLRPSVRQSFFKEFTSHSFVVKTSYSACRFHLNVLLAIVYVFLAKKKTFFTPK